jgi:hypothetical protein
LTFIPSGLKLLTFSAKINDILTTEEIYSFSGMLSFSASRHFPL